MRILYYCMVFMFTLSLLGCNKEEPFQSDIALESVMDEISVIDGRLSFEKTSTFELVMNNMHSKGKPHLDKSIEAIVKREGFVPFSERSTILSKSSSEEMVTEDTLILDPFFGSVINKDKEVEVNGVIYKITKYGTFFGNPLKLKRINELMSSIDSLRNNGSKGISLAQLPGETEVADNLYLVEDGIYRYDTYPDDYYYEEPSVSAGSYSPPPASIIGETLPESFYDNLTTFPFEAHTIVGEIIESIFGRSRAHNIYFSDTRRVRVNFYSVNYVVYSAIGMNVKMQKKNWIGWSETEAQEIRMGWDGMVYEYKYPYYYSGNTPKRTELTKTPGVNDKLAFTVNILNNEYTIDLTKNVKTIIKSIFTWLNQNLAPVSYQANKESLRQFRLLFPDKSVVVVDRYEEFAGNTSSIERVFDWGTCEIKLSFIDGGQWDFNAGMKNNALDFKVKTVSIYGLAKIGNQWNGCRIVNNTASE